MQITLENPKTDFDQRFLKAQADINNLRHVANAVSSKTERIMQDFKRQ